MKGDLERSQSELNNIRDQLSTDFPDYVELSKPDALDVSEVQTLLADDEALVVVDTVDDGAGDYIWAVTRAGAEWHGLDTKPGEIAEIVSGLRSNLDPQEGALVDLNEAHRLYNLTLGRISESLAGKRHLIFVINGAMTSLPPHVLVTADPKGKDLADVEWLINRYAVTVLPAVSSLKVLRSKFAAARGGKPIRAYADPLFSPETGTANTRLASRGFGTFFRSNRLADVRELSGALPRLPETADEARAVAHSLGGSDSDVILTAR